MAAGTLVDSGGTISLVNETAWTADKTLKAADSTKRFIIYAWYFTINGNSAVTVCNITLGTTVKAAARYAIAGVGEDTHVFQSQPNMLPFESNLNEAIIIGGGGTGSILDGWIAYGTR